MARGTRLPEPRPCHYLATSPPSALLAAAASTLLAVPGCAFSPPSLLWRGSLPYTWFMATPRARIKPPYTYREYALLPNDGKRYEIVDGDLYESPAPTPFHQTVSRRLQFQLMSQLEVTGRAWVFNAPVDLILDDETVVQPDLVLVARDQRDVISKRGIEGTASLVVEILSPSTSRNDRVLKRLAYARHRIPEYWIVDPSGQVEAYLLEDEGYVLRARLERTDTLTSQVFVQRRSIKLSLRSSSGGVAGGSAPTKDWCGQFEEVRGRQRRHKPARSGSSWLSAAVDVAIALEPVFQPH